MKFYLLALLMAFTINSACSFSKESNKDKQDLSNEQDRSSLTNEQQSLISIIRFGTSDQLKSFLTTFVDYDFKDNDEYPLEYAIKRGDVEILNILLESSPAFIQFDSEGPTANLIKEHFPIGQEKILTENQKKLLVSTHPAHMRLMDFLNQYFQDVDQQLKDSKHQYVRDRVTRIKIPCRHLQRILISRFENSNLQSDFTVYSDILKDLKCLNTLSRAEMRSIYLQELKSQFRSKVNNPSLLAFLFNQTTNSYQPLIEITPRIAPQLEGIKIRVSPRFVYMLSQRWKGSLQVGGKIDIPDEGALTSLYKEHLGRDNLADPETNSVRLEPQPPVEIPKYWPKTDFDIEIEFEGKPSIQIPDIPEIDDSDTILQNIAMMVVFYLYDSEVSFQTPITFTTESF